MIVSAAFVVKKLDISIILDDKRKVKDKVIKVKVIKVKACKSRNGYEHDENNFLYY